MLHTPNRLPQYDVLAGGPKVTAVLDEASGAYSFRYKTTTLSLNKPHYRKLWRLFNRYVGHCCRLHGARSSSAVSIRQQPFGRFRVCSSGQDIWPVSSALSAPFSCPHATPPVFVILRQACGDGGGDGG